MDVSDKWNGVYKLIDRKNAEAFMKKFGKYFACHHKRRVLLGIMNKSEMRRDGIAED